MIDSRRCSTVRSHKMARNGVRRMVAAGGAMLADARIGSLADEAGERLFDPRFWAQRSGLTPVNGGRGAAWFIQEGSERWVLRHYRRGGFPARFSSDRFLWTGESRVRAFVEYRLLEYLAQGGLPVPGPVAARYERRGLCYRCDLIMQRVPDARPLSALLDAAPMSDAHWIAVGAVIGRLHAAGVCHADLNAHNILLDGRGAVSIVDLDRGRIRRGAGRWRARNLDRLHRSLLKLSRSMPAGRFTLDAWQSLLAGYTASAPDSRRIAGGG